MVNCAQHRKGHDMPNQAELVSALRSGEYKQGTGRFRSSPDTYCVIGVALDLINPDAWGYNLALCKGYFWENDKGQPVWGYIPYNTMQSHYGLSIDEVDYLVTLNDEKRKPFDYIANVIERGL